MESPSEEKRRNHVITIDPNETVLTAYPYRPHSSLLDFLKGEPKLLGVSSALSWVIQRGEKVLILHVCLQRWFCEITFRE
jgi:hypothetical protein